MSERKTWDVIGQFVDVVAVMYEQQDDYGGRTDADAMRFILSALVGQHPLAASAWDALADEREKRERGTR